MTDEPEAEAGNGRPKFFNNVTGWIGGVTAVVLALAGLKTAYNQLSPSEPAKVAETESAGPAEDQAATAPTTDADIFADLPKKYTGTWKGFDVTLQWRDGVWVETTAEGTDDELVTRYEQLSRTDVMTNAIDRQRSLYIRWPSNGGTLEESEDLINWTRSYDVEPA